MIVLGILGAKIHNISDISKFLGEKITKRYKNSALTLILWAIR